MGVFSAKDSPNVNTKRNTFPLSFSNNLTMQFGKIYPVFVKPCDPGDSFKIKASFGLNFLPTVYPVQTPMKAYLHFFYCRNRTVWTDFMNFYTMKDRVGQNITSSTYVPPYLDFAHQPLGASELVDYMGIPVPESVGNIPSTEFSLTNYSVPPISGDSNYVVSVMNSYPASGSASFPSFTSKITLDTPSSSTSDRIPLLFVPFEVSSTLFARKTVQDLIDDVSLNPDRVMDFNYVLDIMTPATGHSLSEKGITDEILRDIQAAADSLDVSAFYMALYDVSGIYIGKITLSVVDSASVQLIGDAGGSDGLSLFVSFKATAVVTAAFDSSSKVVKYASLPTFYPRASGISTPTPFEYFIRSLYTNMPYSTAASMAMYTAMPLMVNPSSARALKYPLINSFTFDWLSKEGSSPSVELSSPYYSSIDNPNGLKINSLPFRHYEAIYNYFYRDNRNNPLRDSDGNPVYNEVLLPSQLTGGVEKGFYDFHYRNWEQDFLTTCVQEPQLGQAPLVGISSTGVASFSNDDGSITNVQLKTAEDGDTVVGFDTSEGISAPVAHSLVELATQGISISDFRNVNAFQTWLEVQMRKTLRFGDSIQGHFNVNPKYDDYLYPEFIGGVTQSVDTYQVNQTAPSDSSPLGAYAGQAICKGSVPRSISKFCDEPGYIIGLLSIVPQPVYSQILPKHYLRRETLDYHFPEFNNISYQPVPYSEVCPVLAFNEGKDLKSVFGYQRPWYDLISSLDEAHGQFLTTLNGFILSRSFASTPLLGDRFLTVHPEDLNDIFSTKMTDSNDVILGQVYFDVLKKTQISKFGIPSLQIG